MNKINDNIDHFNLIWKGIYYHSMENCVVKLTEGLVARSTIIGYTEEHSYYVRYELTTNPRFETQSLHLSIHYKDEEKVIHLEKDNAMRWRLNDTIEPAFDDCMDVDISLTPLTNTLPLKRLSLDTGTEHTIKVIYIDLLEQSITSAFQQYSKLSTNIFHFENIPNDFEADVQINEDGFVTHYPQLFELVFNK